MIFLQPCDQSLDLRFACVRRSRKRELHLFQRGRKVALRRGHPRQLPVRIPFVRPFLYVYLENGESFILLLLNLKAASIHMKLQPRSLSPVLSLE